MYCPIYSMQRGVYQVVTNYLGSEIIIINNVHNYLVTKICRVLLCGYS